MPALTRPQLRNAAVIYEVGKALGATNRDIQIALITAMTESNLINVNYGDRDSLGLFQQRDPWGPRSVRMDPAGAARMFFTGGRGGQQGLFQVANRHRRGMGEVAQDVQVSAYPGRYATHIPLIRRVWNKVVRMSGGQGIDLATGGPSSMSLGGLHMGGLHPSVSAINALGPAWTPLDDGFESAATPEVGTPMIDPVLGPQNPSELGPWGMTSDWDGGPNSFLPNISRSQFANVTGMVGAGNAGSKGVNGWREAVIQKARQAIGTPYVWGGSQPGGFDCSGLLFWAFNQVGPKDLPRISYQQANMGKRVSIRNLEPGDLVAWNNSTRNPGADHIALYIGRGRIIEAPRTGLSVRVRKVSRGEGAYGVKLPW